jgi:hypothetical protein
MKIIRRKRTVTVETCAFKRWESAGTGDTFGCPNCGKVFERNAELTAANAQLTAVISEMKRKGELIEAPILEKESTDPSCGGECSDK